MNGFELEWAWRLAVALAIAALGIVIASVVNSLVKSAMAWLVGGRKLGLRVLLPMIVAVIAGPALLVH